MNEEMKATIKRAQEHHDAYWKCLNLEDEVQQYGTLGSKSIAHIGALLKVINEQQSALDAAQAEANEASEVVRRLRAELDNASARVNRLEEAMMMVCRSDK